MQNVLDLPFDRRKGWAQWGIKSCAHWLSWSCSVSTQVAREYLRVARALEKIPLITAAFAAGRLSFSKVKAVTRVIDVISEQTLLEQALVHTAAQLERVVRSFRKTDSAGLVEQQSRKTRWFWDEDGMLIFTARLPPDEGAILLAALQMAEHWLGEPLNPLTCDEPGSAPSEPPRVGDSEKAGWSAADAVAVDQQYDRRSERRCHLQDSPGLALSTVERLSCGACVIAVMRSSLGPLRSGEPLRLGRKTRKISPALRRALRMRDGGCAHPGCHRRRHLQAHHVVHWKDGGPTDLKNLLLVWRFHHMQVHEGGFTVGFASPSIQIGSENASASRNLSVFSVVPPMIRPPTKTITPVSVFSTMRTSTSINSRPMKISSPSSRRIFIQVGSAHE